MVTMAAIVVAIEATILAASSISVNVIANSNMVISVPPMLSELCVICSIYIGTVFYFCAMITQAFWAATY